jgi:hypothetical protein
MGKTATAPMASRAAAVWPAPRRTNPRLGRDRAGGQRPRDRGAAAQLGPRSSWAQPPWRSGVAQSMRCIAGASSSRRPWTRRRPSPGARPTCPSRPRRRPPRRTPGARRHPPRRPIRVDGGPRSGASNTGRCSPSSRRSPACRCASTCAWWRTARRAGAARRATRPRGRSRRPQDGIDNGIKRGNPAPKFAASIRDVRLRRPVRCALAVRRVDRAGRGLHALPRRGLADHRGPDRRGDLRREVLSAHRRRRALPGVRRPREAVARGQLPRAARMGEPHGAQGEPGRHALPKCEEAVRRGPRRARPQDLGPPAAERRRSGPASRRSSRA